MVFYPRPNIKRWWVLKTRKYAIAFFVWMAFVTWASLSTFPEDDTPDIDIPHFDKAVHFCFYFGAAVLGTLFIRETTHGKSPRIKTLIVAAVGAIFFGILIEVLQYSFTLNRQGDPLDALANSFGAIIGALAMNWLFSRPKGLKWKN